MDSKPSNNTTLNKQSKWRSATKGKPNQQDSSQKIASKETPLSTPFITVNTTQPTPTVSPVAEGPQVESPTEGKAIPQSANIEDERSIIVRNIPESCCENNDDRMSEDRDALQRLIFKLINDGDEIKMGKTIRLGKNIIIGNPRPLKVVLDSVQQRDLLLSYIPKLRRLAPSIFFHKFYTLDERMLHQKLKEEIQLRTKNGEKNLCIQNYDIVTKILHVWEPIVITKSLVM